jgi:acetylornithine deacetylase
MATDIREKVMAAVSRDLVVDVLTAVVDTPSPTGEEADLARLLVKIFGEHGMEAKLQTLYEDRFNAVGRIRGTGGGPAILFSGHMDSSVRGNEDYLHGMGWRNKAVIVDNTWMYGNGVMNMKNGFASFVAAIDALKRCGVHLPGDIIVAGTAGEVEMAPVDEFQGRAYDGYGIGMWHLITHGYAADFHVLAEPSGLNLLLGMMGTVWAKITTHGAFTHTAWSDRQVNAIREMRKIWDALEAWAPEYRARNEFMGVKPQVNLAAIRGGLPWRAARTPNLCHLYCDIRLAPTVYPLDLQLELQGLIERVVAENPGSKAEVEFYMSRPGTLLSKDVPVVGSVAAAHRLSTGQTPDITFAPPFCTDAIDCNRFGIPTLVYGGAGRKKGSDTGLKSVKMSDDPRAEEGEYVYIDDIVTAARVFALTALDLCSRKRSEILESREKMPGVDLQQAR